jgi:uncharacterized membrane protein
MKTLFLTLAVISSLSVQLLAQASKAPRTEFTIELSATEVELKPGETKEVIVNLYRSKAYSKSKVVLGISSSLPQGITITYEPAEGLIETSTAKITASHDTKPGAYILLLNGTMNHKSKATMLKLTVNDHRATSANKTE